MFDASSERRWGEATQSKDSFVNIDWAERLPNNRSDSSPGKFESAVRSYFPLFTALASDAQHKSTRDGAHGDSLPSLLPGLSIELTTQTH